MTGKKDIDDFEDNSMLNELDKEMGGFIPPETVIPAGKSLYTKFKSGDNRIRIVGQAIIGWELWVEGKPVRRKGSKPEFTEEELANADINKFTGKQKVPAYFWAFPIYNYDTKEVEVLEVTQKKVLKGIEGWLNDEDYGKDPKLYDLVVNRDDETDPVDYSVRAKPPKPLDEGIQAYVDERLKDIDVSALFKGDDPFAKKDD
jgi:hypothetical protein